MNSRIVDLASRVLLFKRKMRFPSFSDELHELLQGRVDYFRLATMALSLQRLENEGVQGAMAEVGVNRGDTSIVIQRAAPDRRYFLFDTFEGFPDDQLKDNQKGDSRFRETSEQFVRGRLQESDKLHIRKGRVPDTLAGLESEQFAFVLLDLDLLEPTQASLEFFYPRLVPGAFFYLHDYNNPESNWAGRRSLDEFLADKPEQVIDIADIWGSALFRKQ